MTISLLLLLLLLSSNVETTVIFIRNKHSLTLIFFMHYSCTRRQSLHSTVQYIQYNCIASLEEAIITLVAAFAFHNIQCNTSWALAKCYKISVAAAQRRAIKCETTLKSLQSLEVLKYRVSTKHCTILAFNLVDSSFTNVEDVTGYIIVTRFILR